MNLYDIEQYSQSMINELIQMNVTDVHFVPMKGKYHLTYRLNGKLLKWKELRTSLADRLVSHFKYQSGMDIGERRRPQSAAMVHYNATSAYSLRLSTLPTHERESLAIRFLPHLSSQTLPFLSLLPHSRKTLFEISKMERGLCLFSGPTGSGKSTTLYAIIEQMVKIGERSIVTIEDPVERPIPSIIQVEVNKKAGLTFDEVLRASLRHDPDVILIGEIRDEVTAALAIRAALTGHLILATIHASSSSSALLRMMDLGVSKLDLAECSQLVLSQRLVQTTCRLCQGPCMPYCNRNRQMGRAALFDVLEGESLKSTIFNKRNDQQDEFLHSAKKAWALGYLADDEVIRVASDG